MAIRAIPTLMQMRAFNAYLPGESTQAQVAPLLGIKQPALSRRLHRYRERMGIDHPTPRHKRKKPAPRFVQLSAFVDAN